MLASSCDKLTITARVHGSTLPWLRVTMAACNSMCDTWLQVKQDSFQSCDTLTMTAHYHTVCDSIYDSTWLYSCLWLHVRLQNRAVPSNILTMTARDTMWDCTWNRTVCHRMTPDLWLHVTPCGSARETGQFATVWHLTYDSMWLLHVTVWLTQWATQGPYTRYHSFLPCYNCVYHANHVKTVWTMLTMLKLCVPC